MRKNIILILLLLVIFILFKRRGGFFSESEDEDNETQQAKQTMTTFLNPKIFKYPGITGIKKTIHSYLKPKPKYFSLNYNPDNWSSDEIRWVNDKGFETRHHDWLRKIRRAFGVLANDNHIKYKLQRWVNRDLLFTRFGKPWEEIN